MSNQMLRCAIYIRVSTAEQRIHGKSLQAQEECLRKYAEEQGMIIAGVYADEGQTARKELRKRKAIHCLLEDVKRGKIDTILFWKMDRWFRNVSDFYKVQDVLDAYNVTWKAVAEPNMNMETRDGRLNLNIMLSIGQNEVDTTSERIKFTVDSMIKNGRLVFGDANMPTGYMVGEADGEKRMIKNPAEAPIVEEVFSYYKTHQNKTKTMRHIQAMFGINFSFRKLDTILKSEFYKGTYRGAPYCPAYLSEEEWDYFQKINRRNIRTAPSGRVYYFSGMIHCPECGKLMTATSVKQITNHKTKEKKTYCYYRCNKAVLDNTCNNKQRLSQLVVENYLLHNLACEFENYRIRITGIEEAVSITHGRIPSEISKEMDRLNMMFQKDRISWEKYEKEYEKLEKEFKEASSVQPVEERDLRHVYSILERKYPDLYHSLSEENKRAFWRGLLSDIWLDKNHQISRLDFILERKRLPPLPCPPRRT